MATEKQIEANRRNALKSRGPRTQAGKEQSRRNALKHGLTAETLEVIPGEDQALLDDRIEAWLQDLGARDEVEGTMIRRAAILSWKLDRADRHESAVITRKIHEQIEVDQIRAHERIPNLLSRLFPSPESCLKEGLDPAPPTRLVRELESSAEGCRRLLNVWGRFLRVAEGGDDWNDFREMAIVRMLGYGFATIDDPAMLDLIVAGRILMKDATVVNVDSWLSSPYGFPFDRAALREACLRQPTSREEAGRVLRPIIEKNISRLEIILRLREEDVDPRESAAVASFDTSVEGERLRRYQTTTLRDMNRTLEVVSKLRSQAQKFEKGEDRLNVARALPREVEHTPVVLRNEPNPAPTDTVPRERTEDVAEAPADSPRTIPRNEPNFEAEGADRIEIPTLGQGADRPPMPLRAAS